MYALGENISQRKQRYQKSIAPQTNSAHKRLQLGSHITEPISASKIYFRSPLVEICTPILYTTRSRRSKSTERGDNFSVANLIYRMGT